MADQVVILRRQGMSDLKFQGELIASEEQSHPQMGPGDTWNKIEIWRLKSGDWIAVRSVKESRVPGGEISDSKIIYRPRVEPKNPFGMADGTVETDAEADSSQIASTMKFLDWSWLAKRLAQNLNWEIIEELD